LATCGGGLDKRRAYCRRCIALAVVVHVAVWLVAIPMREVV
jgi:hypothetical protein